MSYAAFAQPELASDISIVEAAIRNQDAWEVELDIMGAAATIEELKAHLERAPNPESATAQYLQGYLAGCEIGALAQA